MMQRIKAAKAWLPVVIAFAGACSGTAANSTDMEQTGAGAGGGSAGDAPVTGVGTVGRAGSSSGVAGALPVDPPASAGSGATGGVPLNGSGVGGYSSVGVAFSDGGNAGAEGSVCPITAPKAGDPCDIFSECAYRALHIPCPTVVALCGVNGVWELSTPQCTNVPDAPLTCPAQIPKDGWPCNLPTNVKSYDCVYPSDCASTTARCTGPGRWSVNIAGSDCGGASSSG
jgi:hypothetical protein